MWNEFKIGSKILMGFGVVLLLLIIITLASYLGLYRTIGLSSTVMDNSNKSILTLEREIDHLKWVYELEELFVNDEVKEVTVQTDHRLCAMGKWLYGEHIHDFVNGDAELQKLVEAIKIPHEQLHASAIKIDSTYVDFDQTLEPLLYDNWIKHLEWIKKLDYALVRGEAFTGNLNPRESQLGLWLYSFKTENPELKDLVKRWEAPYEQLHQIATRVNLAIERKELRNARALHESEFLPTANELKTIFNQSIDWIHNIEAKQHQATEIFEKETIPALKNVQADFLKIRKRTMELASQADNEMDTGLIIVLAAISIVALMAIIGAVLTAIKMTRGITGPITKLKNYTEEVSIGDLSNTFETDLRDEIGMLGGSMNQMVSDLSNMVDVAEQIADGDLTASVHVRSDKDALGKALKDMVEKLSAIIEQISISASEVAAGSEQLSSASQSMSQGATEQAASVEEISSSINEIASQMQLNAENGEQANNLATLTQKDAEEGNKQMNEMVLSMERITNSSNDISKIIKVIDEIAFQINLLALNAAVEAARAGKYGKGFAVVAEEVRNLASRSAKAASEISEKISVSVGQVGEGTIVVDKTAESLKKMITSIEKIADIVGEISTASKEQVTGIKEVTKGLEQIDRVTQQNSAHAEESASSAEELSAQAMLLNQTIDQFTTSKEGSEATPQITHTTRDSKILLESTQPAAKVEESEPNLESVKDGVSVKQQKQGKTIHLDEDDFGQIVH